MADDLNQRPFRSNDASASGNGGSSGNDPLAELARLIGQNDPFGEFGRNGNNAGRAAQQRAIEPAAEAPAQPQPPQYNEQPYGAPSYGRQTFGGAPLPAGSEALYEVPAHAPGYDTQGYPADNYPAEGYDQPAQTPGYEDAFPPSQEPLHNVHQQFGPTVGDDYYDDVPPQRRRMGIVTIAAVFALAVVGTAGAFGYRALFGSSGTSGPPPVIKAEQTPSKIVPAAANKDAQANKSITDRVGSGQGERLVSREEQPMPVTVNPAFPPPPANGAQASGSGVVGEPKKIRTIAIRPDGTPDPSGASVPEPALPQAAAPQPRVTNVTPVPRQPAPEPARAAPAPVQAPAPVAAAPRQVAPAPQAPSNAPLSLNPNAQASAPARAVAPPQRTAAAPSAPAASGGYAVQVSARRSEEDAQAAFRSLQAQYPSQLAGRQPTIRRVDLGEKGIFYRAMVVAGDASEANQLCSGIKAAGGSCIVQRN